MKRTLSRVLATVTLAAAALTFGHGQSATMRATAGVATGAEAARSTASPSAQMAAMMMLPPLQIDPQQKYLLAINPTLSATAEVVANEQLLDRDGE
jgi:hypothetical protein